jgi:hypothetical protein
MIVVERLISPCKHNINSLENIMGFFVNVEEASCAHSASSQEMEDPKLLPKERQRFLI